MLEKGAKLDFTTDISEVEELLNNDSFTTIDDFMAKSGLFSVRFNGGALVKTKLLKEAKAIDDYDLNLVGHGQVSTYDNAIKSLKSAGYVIDASGGESATTLRSTSLSDKDGKSFDFLLKKTPKDGERLGTFDIDTLTSVVTKKDGGLEVEINNMDGLLAIKNRVSKLNEDTKDLDRAVMRMLVLLAKYDIKEFILRDGLKFDTSGDDKFKTTNQEALSKFTEINKKSKAVCLAKFLSIVPRVRNVATYIGRVAESDLIKNSFPELHKILNSKDFTKFLVEEQSKPEAGRSLNSDMDFFEKIVEYAGDRKKILDELGVLYELGLDKRPIHICEGIERKRKTISAPIVLGRSFSDDSLLKTGNGSFVKKLEGMRRSFSEPSLSGLLQTESDFGRF